MSTPVDPTTLIPGEKLTDHDYDGIREYDNPMPRWWVWTFWATFYFACFYVLFFHVRKDRSEVAAYNREMQAYYEQQTEELLKMGQIDEVLLATLYQTPSAMKEGADIFNKNCVSCHEPNGGGKIGPNLTDDHWLHGNTLMQLYATVRDGVNGKGMPQWSKKLRPDEVLKVAAFVGSLRGKNVDGGKAPEGKPLPIPPLPDTRKATKDAAPASK